MVEEALVKAIPHCVYGGEFPGKERIPDHGLVRV